MQWLIDFFTARMDIPTPYSWFHILFICLTLTATVLICTFFRKCNDKTFRKIIFILWLITIVFEVYKQILYTFDYSPRNVYKMYVFPFQFCSLAFFAYPFIIWGKESKFRDALIMLSATFIFFGGFGLYMVPTSFQEYIGINIQTMVHHGVQIIVGIFILCHETKKYTIKNFLNSLIVYACVLAIAITLNETVFPLLPADNCDFNLFYISRHVENQLPVLAAIWHKSYALFLFAYIVGFAGVAFVVYLTQKYIYKLVVIIKTTIKRKKQSKQNSEQTELEIQTENTVQ